MNDFRNETAVTGTGLSPDDFLLLGMDAVAAIRPIRTESGTTYGIFAADGQQLGTARSREIAQATAIQNGLHPVDMH